MSKMKVTLSERIRVLENELRKERADKEYVVMEMEEHIAQTSTFLKDMYEIMIDPLEDGPLNVTEVCAKLLEAAKKSRELGNVVSGD